MDIERVNKAFLNDYIDPEVYKESGLHYCTTFNNNKSGEQNLVIVRLGEKLLINLDWRVGDPINMVQGIADPHTLCMIKKVDGNKLTPAVVSKDLPYEKQVGGIHCCNYFAVIDTNTPIPRTYGKTIRITDYETINGGVEGEDYILCVHLSENMSLQ